MLHMNEITVGIGGAAGDGIDKSSETLAKTGGRLGQEKVYSQGDHLNALIALNQDSIERHAAQVESGGAVLFNADKLKVNIQLRDNVLTVPLPVAKLIKPFAPVAPVMQNTVAVGAFIFLAGLDFEVASSVMADTIGHKGKAVIDQNVG